MEIKELFNYFLEKEGYLFKNDDKRDELLFEVSKDLFNSRTKKGKIQNDYSFLEFLESSCEGVINEEQLKEDFKNYKSLVLKILEEIPDDYDLKSDLIFNGIDFDNFDDEKNYNAYRSNRIYEVLIEEIKRENDIGEISFDDLNEVINQKFKKYGVDKIEKDSEFTITQLEKYLNEIESIIKESKFKDMAYPDFVLGRMYFRTLRKLFNVYESYGDNEKLEEKYWVLRRGYIKDYIYDRFDFRNELGFISYRINDMNCYEGICKDLKTRKKDGLVEYFLKNYSNVFKNSNNDKYIDGIIKRNFVFFPILMFRSEAGAGGRSIFNPSKGSYEEAIQMIYYFYIYSKNTFKNCEDYLIKDFMFSIKLYFNHYFNDNGITYSFFKILEEYFNSIDEDFYISDLENDYIKKYGFIEHEQFEKVFQNLCKTHLIKKINKTTFIFNFEMEWMIDFDLNGDNIIKERIETMTKNEICRGFKA